MCEFVCRREAVSEASQGRGSGSQEDATPTAANKGESEDGGDKSDLQTVDRNRAGHPALADRGSCRFQGWIQVDCSWEHRGNRYTESRNSEGVNLFSNEVADSTFPRSRECSDRIDLMFYRRKVSQQSRKSDRGTKGEIVKERGRYWFYL
jgi:hypothetical protein